MPQLQEPASCQGAEALYDNVAECADELAFRKGDILTVLECDTGGQTGWWLCSLRGRTGICPGNRLKILSNQDLELQKEGKRRSWHVQPNKVVVPQRFGDVYLYDQPKPRETFQYDVPPTSHSGPVGWSPEPPGESYDVPRPLTPSSSLSSLTTDSNRSSLFQEYDTPRAGPPRPLAGQPYDCPSGLPLDMGSALETLARHETEAASAIARLLGYAGPCWRQPAKLQPRLPQVKAGVGKLRNSLEELAALAEGTLSRAGSCRDRTLLSKLRPLVETVRRGQKALEEAARELDRVGWEVEVLGREGTGHEPDALDRLVDTAATLTDDIRQIASFIQGNSTLLFKKRAESSTSGRPVPGPGKEEEGDYVNIETGNLEEAEVDNGGERNGGDVGCREPVNPIDPAHLQILHFYLGQAAQQTCHLTNSIDGFQESVLGNQPPRLFLSHIKQVILTAHRLVHLGDSAARCLGTGSLRVRLREASDQLTDALSATAHKSRLAALHFPSVAAVQDMVDSVLDLSHLASQLKMTMITS